MNEATTGFDHHPRISCSRAAGPVAVPQVVARRCQPGSPGLPVLVVEDSPIIRERLGARISRLPGVKLVGMADNGLEGLRLFSEHQPDVVLLDMELPAMTGLKLLQRFKQERAACKVIVLTTYAFAELRQCCLDLGADWFFSKAMEFEDALNILEETARAQSKPGHRGEWP